MEKKQIKKINLNELKNVLSPKEMKNVTGGSGGIMCSSSFGYFPVDFCDDCEAIGGYCHYYCC